MPLFYDVTTGAMALALRLLSTWQVEGRERVPSGPLIVVANHLSFIDPPLLGASLPRRLVFLAKRELFHGLGGWFVRAYGAIEVHRGEFARQGLVRAEAALHRGLALGVFPEGKRHPRGGMGPAHAGAVLLACRTGAPLLPVGITGSERVQRLRDIWCRPTIRVIVGRPITLPSLNGTVSKRELVAWNRQVMVSLARLLPEPYQGVYRPAAVGAAVEG